MPSSIIARQRGGYPSGYRRVSDLPDFYDANAGEPTGADLVRNILGNYERRYARQRQEESDAMAREDRARQMATQDEDRAIKMAELQQRVASMTSEADLPSAPKEVSEGAFVNPEEAAYAGVEPGFKPTGTTTTQVPTAPRSTRLTVGGRELDIPLRYKEQVEAETESAADKALEQKQKGEMVYVPGVGMANKALIPLFSARERIGEFGDVKVVPGGYLTPDNVFHDTTPPTPASAKAGGSWVTDSKSGQRVWKSDTDIAAAPTGTYSDVRPPNARVVKADPAKLKMAISALGGPDVPNSLWALATEINKDAGMMAALKGVGKRKIAEMLPEVASQSGDPQLVKINMYNTAIQGFASSIAKAFGESGVLTNQDIARATGLFPKPGESPTTTVQKLQRVKYVMESGMQDPASFREIFGRDPSPTGAGAGPGSAPAGTGTPDDPIVLE